MKAPDKEQLLADVLSNATWQEIAEKYGYTDSRFLRKLARRYGLPPRRIFRKPSKEALSHMILQEGLSPSQVAEKLGYGSGGWSNIYKYCRDYGIKFDGSVNHDLRAVPFTQRQKDIALGTLLGDGYLRPSGKSFSLSFTHGEKQLEYLRWKLQAFDNFVVTKELYRRSNGFHGNAPTYSFSTISHPFLQELHLLCYPDGKKHVSPQWLSLLSPLSLAVWYMDDGSLNRHYGTVTFSTNSFSYQEHTFMQAYFLDRYSIDAKIEPRRKGQYALRINPSQTSLFFQTIAPHVPDCMSYKLR